MSPPTTSEQFLEMVVRSGLLSHETLRPYTRTAAADKPDGQKTLANQLVRDRLLTPFQGRQLLAGKIRGYFLGDKYKVLSLIGTGGTGHVFLCEHLVLQRLVAVKLLQRGAADMSQGGQAAAVERFVREARAVAALDHPNIVRVHDMELTGAIPFMVMEYVDGSSLHQILAQAGPLPIARAVHCLSQAASGLQHAHEHGLIHRDIKPGNLLLERTGIVKMLDLGLARFLRDASRNNSVTARYNDQSIVGTVDYMSPEQALNSPVLDIRSDIYSLGATFYYLLAGRPPFEGDSTANKLIAHQLHDPNPITSVRSDVPRGVAAVLVRMMAKKPDARYQTPAEVVAALAPWTRSPIPPPATSEMPRLPPSAYRLGLALGPGSAIAGSGQGSLARWDFPLSPDATDPNGETPLATEEPTFRKPPEKRSTVPVAPPALPDPTAPLPGNAEQQATNPNTSGSARSVRPVLIGTGAGLIILLTGLIWWWPTLAGRHNTPPSNSSGSGPSGTPPSSSAIITGSGSTAIKPAMEYWAELYEQQTGVKIKYDGIGSGRGVENMIDKVLDFGCTDAYMTEAQLAKAQSTNGDVIHLPLVMGAVVAIYNLPEVSKQLRFTGPVLADIYLGKIQKWNHESIKASNPGVILPDRDIAVIRRSDSSGTTSIWTDYLSKVSLEWDMKAGRGNTVKWPVGEDAEKSDGMAKAVSRKVGAIGYVELSFALERNLKFAQVKNSAGGYVDPSLDSVTAAANASLQKIRDDLRYTLTDPPGDDSYPIAGSTWVVVYMNQPGAKGKELVKFLRWAVHEGQAHLADMRYAPLPSSLVQRIDDKLATFRTGK
jgi:phosphate ABC transporter phosphate-binding protein